MQISHDDFIQCIENIHILIQRMANASDSKLEDYLFIEEPKIQPSEVIDELYPLFHELNKLFYTPS